MAAKKMGLHGSPAHHLEQAEGGYEEAENEYAKADKFLRGGSCAKAHKMLLDAVGYHEAAITHEDESESSVNERLRKKVGLMKKKISSDFASKCIIGGGLSGMRRRRKK
jgi:hypothetical protein